MNMQDKIYEALDDKRMMKHVKNESIWHLYRKQAAEYILDNFNVTPKE